MLEIVEERELVDIGKALASETRIRILKILTAEGKKNFKELASALGMSTSGAAQHIGLLEQAGLIRIETESGVRGTQKLCTIAETRIILDLRAEEEAKNTYTTEIPVGMYSRCEVHRTCGLATPEKKIGEWDDPRYFDDPERVNAGILWLTRGYVEYRIPNYIGEGKRVTSIRFVQELSSEAPGFNENWRSNIVFTVNGKEAAVWECPGDFGLNRGVYTPDWWVYGVNQYGLLKALVINQDGTYIDGKKVGDTTVGDLGIDGGKPITYRLSAPDKGPERGGLTLFGKGFGNYAGAISVTIQYDDSEKTEPGSHSDVSPLRSKAIIVSAHCAPTLRNKAICVSGDLPPTLRSKAICVSGDPPQTLRSKANVCQSGGTMWASSPTKERSEYQISAAPPAVAEQGGPVQSDSRSDVSPLRSKAIIVSAHCAPTLRSKAICVSAHCAPTLRSKAICVSGDPPPPPRCRICEERFPTDAETRKYLADYIEALPDEIKASKAELERRLRECDGCENLAEYTCAKCGCYACARAAKKTMSCPDGKW